MNRGLYVTGTDTDIGKTLVSVALLRALRARGLQVAGMKPVASGCTMTGEIWCNADALALQAAASPPIPEYLLVNPYALPDPAAPEIAAANAGIELRLQPIEQAYRNLFGDGRMLVVEGVGGWMAPLAAGREQAELVRRLGPLPVLLVVGLRLGCISHARLTARAVVADGFELVGWVGSTVDGSLMFADQVLDALHREIDAPCLGVLPHFSGTPDAPERFLDLDPWLGKQAPAGG